VQTANDEAMQLSEFVFCENSKWNLFKVTHLANEFLGIFPKRMLVDPDNQQTFIRTCLLLTGMFHLRVRYGIMIDCFPITNSEKYSPNFRNFANGEAT